MPLYVARALKKSSFTSWIFFGFVVSLLQVFQVRKMRGQDKGKIFAMKVLRKVSTSFRSLSTRAFDMCC